MLIALSYRKDGQLPPSRMYPMINFTVRIVRSSRVDYIGLDERLKIGKRGIHP